MTRSLPALVVGEKQPHCGVGLEPTACHELGLFPRSKQPAGALNSVARWPIMKSCTGHFVLMQNCS